MNEVKRIFLPGEEWLYFKVYCGIFSADYILNNDMLLIIEELFKKKLIDKWFFVRYNDSDNHLRIRFHLINCTKFQNVMQVVNTYFTKLIEKKTVHDITLATYKREIERYGASTIVEIEKLFYHHSNKIIKFFNVVVPEYDEIIRILASLLMMRDVLKHFEIPLEQCRELTHDICSEFRSEYNMDRNNTKKISHLYSTYKHDILLILRKDKDPEYLKGINKAFKIKKKEIEIMKVILNKTQKEGRLISELITSLIHMNINRMFRTKSREYEMLCYNFMNKYYKSTIAQR